VRLRSRWVAGLAAVIGVAACGSGGGSSTVGAQSNRSSAPTTGSKGGFGGSGSVPDACSTLTESAAATITGDVSVIRAASSTPGPALEGGFPGNTSDCYYGSPSGSGGGAEAVLKIVTASTRPTCTPSGLTGGLPCGSALDEYAGNILLFQPFSTITTQLIGMPAIPGLGDKAFKEENPTAALVLVTKGDVFFALVGVSATRDGNSIESGLERLARQLVGQL
jgi:hypothetical protein